MTEPGEPKSAPFDAEWEIQKMRGRFTDILNMIEDLKSKDKSLSARISRLRLASIEEEGEEVQEPREPMRQDIEDLSLSERALLYSEIMDRLESQRRE